MSYIGVDKIGKMYLGGTEIARAYFGDKPVYRNKLYDAEVEYLESTGTQYIDLGSPIGGLDNFETKVEFLTNIFQWFGAFDKDYNHLAFNSTYTNDTDLCFYCSNSQTTSYRNYCSCPINEPVIIKWFGNPYSAFTLNETVSVGTCSSRRLYTPTNNAYLFARNNKGEIAIEVIKPMRVYYFRSEKFNLIPVRVGTIGYMYDKVSNQLFGNAGSGNFIVGPDVIKGDIKK